MSKLNGRTLIVGLIFGVCQFIQVISGECPSRYVTQEVWDHVTPYLIPNQHPVKKKLDELIPDATVFCDMSSMVAAGFDHVAPQHRTKVIVTRHPLLPGYVIKAYLDEQDYYEGRPEYYYWVKRAQGARLIQGAIKKYHYEHLIKVPKKWIYLLPDPTSSPKKKSLRKMFILVEEDMQILDNYSSKKRWGSSHATKELLSALYQIITEFRFSDCAKPANCPFSIDGRVALVDTQSFNKRSRGLWKLTSYLSPDMQLFWNSLKH